ncbi:MAG: CPBP family intramembrane metalloprotease [Chloroflexi bacterium]|nr:CPBP family intramembrane metalloprotease [Chloroflexota bacterium]
MTTLPDGAVATTAYRDVPWSKKELLIGGVLGLVLVVAPVLLLGVGIAVISVGGVSAVPVWLWGPVVALSELLLLVPPFVVLRRHRVGRAWLGFRRHALSPALPLGCGFLGASFVINLLWALLLKHFQLDVQPNYMPLFGTGLTGLAWALFAGALVAPFAEETFFRGFLFAGFRKEVGLLWGTLLSAAFFALVHFTPTAIVPIFVLGVFFALLYEASGSIWPGIVLHSTINTLALTAGYLAMR